MLSEDFHSKLKNWLDWQQELEPFFFSDRFLGDINKTLEELRLRKNVIIGFINREGKTFIPHGRDDLRPGDSVVVVTTITGLSDLDDIKGSINKQ